MTKQWALRLLKMIFPMNKPSKLNHCLTEIQVVNILKGAIDTYADGDDLLLDTLRTRVLQVVQNRKRPYTKEAWLKRYADIMQSRIIGEVNYDYCMSSAEASLDAIGSPDWMLCTPADAVQGEMECWDE